ncbi:uncharacterized protein [Lepisosteus oculatus]|uniref:uncharacterized protein isoform X2 n=1 Tax=Lepisosteus oculatus TaxID=7918 RepID=UPI003715ACDC
MSPKECSCEPSRVKWLSSCVQRTGCQCPGPDEVLAVLEGMSSSDEESGKLLIEELLSLLQRNTKGTLPVILGFLESPQVTTAHRSAVLQAVEKLLRKTSAQHLDESLAKSTVSMALNEMTMSPKWLPDWQQPASNIVVCVVRDHYDSTMDMVLSFFQPGVLPHHTLLNAVGDISRNCSRDIARDIVRLLDLLVPVLPLAVTDKMKAMMAFALEGLYESWAKFQGPGQCVQDCSSQVIISFDVVHRWLPSSEPKVTEAIVLALAAMCCLLPEEKLQSELPAVLQAFQPLYAAELDISYSRINKSLSVLVGAAVPKARPVLESQLEQLLTMVHAQDLAVLMGLCASVHLDVVLSVLKRLETQLTDPAFPCNEQGSRSDFTCALILCYGQVALKAPAEDLLQRMDTDFMERLRHHVTTKEPSVRLSLCRSVGMIAQAVRSASPSGAPSFPAKAELLATMMALDLLQFFGSSYTLDDSLEESLREGILYLAAQDLRQTIQSLVTLISPSESSLSEVWQVLSTSQVVSDTVKHLADHLGLMREMKVDDPELDINRHTEEQLAAQSSALTEQETPAEPVVLQALLGLITVLSIADKSQAKALVPFVYCRARPCLESESPEVRRVTVVLLGQLVRLGSEKARLNKEVHSSLVSVLLNLTDPSPEVIQASWTVLQHFTLECVLSMKEMCRILITSGQFSLAQRLALQGAQSRRAWVRESAAIFIGLQVQQLQRRLCSCFALRRAQRALRILLQDPEPQVRERAAEAMGLFARP